MVEDRRPDFRETLKHLDEANMDNVRPGDLVLFDLIRETRFLPLIEISRGFCYAAHAGCQLASTVVITQDIPPRVLFGAEMLRKMKEDCVRHEIEQMQERAEKLGFSLGTTEETRPYLEDLAKDMLEKL